MNRQSKVCIVLLTLAGISGGLGYMRSRPTALERFAIETARWSVSLNPSEKPRIDEALEALQKARIRRGLPFFVAAGLAGIFGVAALGNRRD